MDYEQFLHECSKTELVSFVRAYQASMNRRKNPIKINQFYNERNKKQENQKGGEKVDDSKEA